MTDNHPITPPPELVTQWWGDTDQDFEAVAVRAARWGADQELDACCWWADATGWQGAGSSLRLVRRPKPPSLKEQALAVLDDVQSIDAAHYNILRNALEQLND